LQKDLTLSRPSSRMDGSTAKVIRSQSFIPSPLPVVHEHVLLFDCRILLLISVNWTIGYPYGLYQDYFFENGGAWDLPVNFFYSIVIRNIKITR
jgi:hypothetical protein